MGLIDLSNDVFSFPPTGMRERIAQAEVLPGIYAEDASAAALESKLAALLGMESALYFLTGTAANLVAHMTHCQPGDEVICGEFAHTFNLEAGGAQRVAGLSVRTVAQEGARLDPEQVARSIRSGEVTQPRSALLWIDQPSRGFVLGVAELCELAELAWSRGLKIHVDGARLFEAAIALDVPVTDLTRWCDSVMVSFTKGLCAPMGAALVGSADFIERARRNRKVIGAEVRHSAFMAAAGVYALDHMVPRLADDRQNARRLAGAFAGLPHLRIDREDVQTNRFVLIVDEPLDPVALAASLRRRGVFVNPPKPPGRGVNIVTHY
ncbi:MAG TPA: threonine aldolase family protein, partial [Chloroflexota bacterium]